MTAIQFLSADPRLVIPLLCSLVALAFLVTKGHYRVRVRQKGFELLIEPHHRDRPTSRRPKMNDVNDAE